MSARRGWEGHLYKGSNEIGFAEGSLTIDENLLKFYRLGKYDIAERRATARNLEATIDHGYIDKTMFMASAMAVGPIGSFDIRASFSDHSILMSGCIIANSDWTLPADGWVTESITLSVKEFG